MLLITARIGDVIRIAETKVSVTQVRGPQVRISVQEPPSSGVAPALLIKRVGESFRVDETEVVLKQVRGPQVRLGINAPRHIKVTSDRLVAAGHAKEGACALSDG